ncbi:hypothetical protein ACHHYP_00337 [Achlya hypogyna]|uniref:tRNA wybutosine-synthesizing protein 3 n=1 Tax=Achlya hypogyna TaxID=1202772 RepID=A0A1V9ZUQ2_ACHHY|nr:hypothetical protein ACHHYP_00337 [Achlya hypogyna]
MAFDASKRESLQKLQDAIDKSPKGSIDAPIVDMINALNAHPNYVTSSSCSGRIAVFCGVSQTADSAFDGSSHLITKGGKWLVSSHAPVSYEELHANVLADPAVLNGMVIFKHEPFIMHVQCRDEEAAKIMLQCGLACGFRESGVVLGNKKTMVAIRTTANSMEIPIALNGRLMVDDAYLRWILAIANEKFAANVVKTQRFMAELESTLFAPPRTRLQRIAANKSELMVPRAGHSSVFCTASHWNTPNLRLDQDRVYMVGGQGQSTTGTSRLGDVVVVDAAGSVVLQTTSAPPLLSPRMHHSAVVHKGAMVVFGGRGSPTKALNDVIAISLPALEGAVIATAGDAPSPRWGHASVLVGSKMVIIGGRNATEVFTDVIVLDLATTPPTWHRGAAGPAMFQHAAVAVRGKVYCFGGRAELDALGDISLARLAVYDVAADAWTFVATAGAVPPPRASLQAVAVQEQHVVVTGGSSSERPCERDVFSLHLGRMAWHQHELLDSSAVLTGHSMVYDDARQVCVVTGGSCQCFGFGSVYSPVYSLRVDLTAVVDDKPAVAALATTNAQSLVLVVEKARVKTFKTHLESRGLYDKTRRIQPALLRDHVQFIVHQDAAATCDIPVTHEAPTRVKKTPKAPAVTEGTVTRKQTNNKAASPAAAPAATEETASPLLGVLVAKETVKAVKTRLEALGTYDKNRRIHPSADDPGLFVVPVTAAELPAELEELAVVADTQEARKPVLNPNVLIHRILKAFAATHHLPAVPDKFEYIADVLLLPKNSCVELAWTEPSVWLEVTTAVPTIRRIARNADVDLNEKRQSHVSLLYVHPSFEVPTRGVGWVEVRENGLKYAWNIEKVMFSSGNVTEKARMARSGCAGETIVDMYAGIGYYVVPFLVHGKAAHVHALEWNPDSVECLRYNLERNRVSDRCTVHPGDNRVTGPTLGAIADRVNLGLLPTSEHGWPVAVQVLKASGGMLHVHENVSVDNMETWKEHVVASIRSLGEAIGKAWTVELVHLERVKSYAPKVFHIVADIRCAPRLG